MKGPQQVLIKFKETRKGFYARGDWFLTDASHAQSFPRNFVARVVNSNSGCESNENCGVRSFHSVRRGMHLFYLKLRFVFALI